MWLVLRSKTLLTKFPFLIMNELLKKAMQQCEYADIRYESIEGISLEVKDGKLEKAIPGKENGASIRVICNGAWGFFSTNNVEKKNLNNALQTAIKLAKASSLSIKEKVKLAKVKSVKDKVVWKVKKSPQDISIEKKFKLMAEMEKEIKSIEGILSVSTNYFDKKISMNYLNSEGTEIETELTKTLIQANLVAKKDGNIIGYRTRIGGTAGFELFDKENPIEKGVIAGKSAVSILSAEKSPSGNFPVIADSDLAGVFVHEALGHAVESDLVVSGESILEGKIGEKIANENITIVDDPTLPFGFGSFPYDAEGVKGQRKVLIEKGILKSFILNREMAYKLNMIPNGGARAESYAVRPLVRMSNTMIENGDYDFEEMLEGIKFGIYAKGTRGGQVDTAKGTFQFSAQQAFLIENGKITKQLKDVSLSGLTLEILKNIDAIGNDYKFGDAGFCGKGQMVPVGDGGPHIRIKRAVVG